MLNTYPAIAKQKDDIISLLRHVVIITESFLPLVNGVTTTCVETIRYLRHIGINVTLVVPDSAPDEFEGCHIVKQPTVRLPFYREIPVVIPTSTIDKAIKDTCPDLVINFGGAFATALGSRIATRKGIPCFNLNQTDFVQYASEKYTRLLSPIIQRIVRYLVIKMVRWVHSKDTLTFIASPSYRDTLINYGLDPNRLCVWPHFVDVTHFSPNYANRCTRRVLLNDRSDNKLVVISVSRLAPEKDIHLLSPIADISNVAFTVIGDGPSRAYLQNIFGYRAHFTGMLLGNDLATAYASADVFVSTSSSETFGLTTLEAQSSGLPVVALKANGIQDIVIDGETGFLCTSVSEMEERVIQLRDNTILRKKLGMNGRKHAEEVFGTEHVMERLFEIYGELRDN